MARDIVLRTQFPEGLTEESFTKSNLLPATPSSGRGKHPGPIKEVAGREKTHTSQALSECGVPKTDQQ